MNPAMDEPDDRIGPLEDAGSLSVSEPEDLGSEKEPFLAFPSDLPFPQPPTDLPVEDGIPLESDWHRLAINLLVESITLRWPGRTDFYAGGNMFIHFSAEHVRNRDFRGPDVFLVKDVDGTRPRNYWAIWEEEGRYPDLIVELMSSTTHREDLGRKKDVYEKVFHTHEYFCYDPSTRELLGWRLVDGRFEPIAADASGRLPSVEVEGALGVGEGVYLGRTGPWLRLFDAQGKVVPFLAEEEHRKAEEQRRIAEEQRRKAKQERRKATEERRKAKEQRLLAEAEKARADALEAEVARLKARLGKGEA